MMRMVTLVLIYSVSLGVMAGQGSLKESLEVLVSEWQAECSSASEISWPLGNLFAELRKADVSRCSQVAVANQLYDKVDGAHIDRGENEITDSEFRAVSKFLGGSWVLDPISLSPAKYYFKDRLDGGQFRALGDVASPNLEPTLNGYLSIQGSN